MNLCKVGNQTSSQDPHAVNSRIFVGNLNTFQVNKIDVEKVFQRYGRIVGESSTLIGIMFHQSKKKSKKLSRSIFSRHLHAQGLRLRAVRQPVRRPVSLPRGGREDNLWAGHRWGFVSAVCVK